MQFYNLRGYWHMDWQCPSFKPRRLSYRNVVCPICGSYERVQMNGSCEQDLPSTGVFAARTAVAATQHPNFQPSFSQTPNPSANRRGSATLTPSNGMQRAPGTQQPTASGVSRSPAKNSGSARQSLCSSNQIAVFADEQQPIAKNYLLIDKEEPP